jgi:hypothetical protein
MHIPVRHFAVGLVAAVVVGGAVGEEGTDDAAVRTVLTLQDEAIDESSGVVVRGDRLYTVNDSGDGPHVYAVDRRSGETTAVTTYDDEDPVDVEALAAGRGGTLWVGDIGDNSRARGSVTVHRLVPRDGTVEATSFELTYPDGPHDAETLLVHPRTGRLLVVTKRPLVGGVVFRAPAELSAGDVHRLQRVASVPGMVTDGTFVAGGRRVLLRTYGSAAVYTYPGFEQVVDVELPEQEQGEGIAVGADGTVYLTTEGAGSDVLAMRMPAVGVAEEPDDPAATDRADRGGGGVSADTAGDAVANRTGLGRPPGYLVAGLLGAGLLGLVLRASRRRSRRRR